MFFNNKLLQFVCRQYNDYFELRKTKVNSLCVHSNDI